MSQRTSFRQVERDLETLSQALRYRQWLYRQIRGALGLNALGALGWWASHVLQKGLELSTWQLRFFDRFVVPVAACTERFLPPPFGLSPVAWVRKGQ